MWRKTDYTGMKFGKWTVIGTAPNSITKGGYPVSMWDCMCECGTRRAVRGNDLRLGKSVSCGCSMAETPTSRKHGVSGSHLYMVYHGMKARCYNQNNRDYKHYGGRGIKICNEWEDYTVFEEWAIANGYKQGLTIERIDVNGDYCPDNCKWITQQEQTRNKRTTVYLIAFGKTKPLLEWADEYGISPKILRHRIKRGWAVEDAISLPLEAERRKMKECTNES